MRRSPSFTLTPSSGIPKKSIACLMRTWDQKLSSGSLLTFMSTHFFQFRFAETEQYWLITLTFFRTCERLARARNLDTISTSPSYPAVTLSTQCLARQWIHVLLISPVSLTNCQHFLREGGLGHELDSRRFRSVHSEPSVANCARAVCNRRQSCCQRVEKAKPRDR